MSLPVRESPRTEDAAGADADSAARDAASTNAHGASAARGWKAPRVLAGFVLVFGLLFVFLSRFVPIWHTDVWGHLAYGRYVWQQGALPSTEPLMPLARGVSFVDTVWLSQSIGYGLYSRFGVAALQFLYAAPITVACAALAHAVYSSTRSASCALLGVALFGWINYQPLQIVRPQLAGMVCFVLLLAWLVAGRVRSWHWWAVPLLFAVWTNLHGSFPVGLALLALFAVGRAIDIAWRTKRIRMIAADQHLRRLLLLLGLSAVAVLVNPYGPGIYAEILAVARNPNLRDLVEWKPLTVRMLHGQAAVAVTIALCLVYYFSRRRVRAAELLLLAGLGVVALWHSRMLVWWGAAAAYCLPLHLSGAWRRLSPLHAGSSPRSGRWAVVALVFPVICCAVTPFGSAMVHGPSTDPAAALRHSVSVLTPVDVVDYLHQHPLRGQVFNTYEWGDYLLWAGPPDLKIFVASHAHLVPRDVWIDYMRISTASAGWDAALDRYGVNAVIVDRAGRARLIRLLGDNANWRVDYEDRIAVVFVRRESI